MLDSKIICNDVELFFISIFVMFPFRNRWIFPFINSFRSDFLIVRHVTSWSLIDSLSGDLCLQFSKIELD